MSNIGTIKPPPLPEAKRKPYIPRFFEGKAINSPLPYSESVRIWGMWDGKALRDCSIYHQTIKAGDTFSLPGDILWSMAMHGDAEFSGSSVKKEAEILAAADKILQPLRNHERPEFQAANFATSAK